jgi:ABC-type phosphate transport system substrate-binding protein
LTSIWLQRDKEAWEKAQQSGTVEVFEQYLAAYPQGKYVGEAQKQVASLLRQQVLSNPQDTELRRCYLATPRH